MFWSRKMMSELYFLFKRKKFHKSMPNNLFMIYFLDVCGYTGMSWNKYHRFNVIENFVKCLASEYPDKTERYSIGTSFEGRKLNLLRITNNLRVAKRLFICFGLSHYTYSVTQLPVEFQ